MHLLERETTLASLAEYAGDARRGEGRLVLVAGEAGVGKTALLERFEELTPEARWLWGACDGLYTPRPLGPLFDIAARVGGDLLAASRAGASREVLFGSLLRQIGVPGRLTVVAVEDVHWADEATLDMLRFLGRRIRTSPTLLLVSYRDDGLAIDAPLRLALGELVALRPARRVSLPTLSAEAVREMVQGRAVEADAVFRLTGGNPFYLTEVLEAEGSSLPGSARDAVLARVARLGAGAREVLEAAALIGSRIEPWLLEAVFDDAPSRVEACVATGLLAYDEGGLRFRHEIVRVAVEDAVTAPRRAQVHRLLLDALGEAGSADCAQLAYHAEGAGACAAVLTYAVKAARAAACLGSHREAVAQYERAIRFADDGGPAFVADLYDGLAYESSLLDRWQYAADARQAALSLWRQVGDRRREAETLRMLSRTMWRLCRGAEAGSAALDALAALDGLPAGPELAWAYANLATQNMLGGQPEEAIRLAERAIGLAERLDEPAILSEALNTTACSLSVLGKAWQGHMSRALDVALAADLQEQAGRAYANAYGIACEQLRFTEAAPLFLRGVEYCDEHDIGTFGTCLRGQRTLTLEQTGSWDEALKLGQRLLDPPHASPVNRLNPLVAVGRILARRADPDVWTALEEVADAADSIGEPIWIVSARLARTEACWLEGRVLAAREEIEKAAAAVAWHDGWARGEVEVWRRRLGLPRRDPGDVPAPPARHLAGDLEGAAVAWIEVGCPYQAAMALADSRKDDTLRRALTMFDELGAVAAARLTRRTMRRLGLKAIPSGPRAATRDNAFRLTRREQEVLELLSTGMANAEISERLFISERTVDHHVSAVLTKMKVRSRGAAVSEALRAGLVDPVSAI